MAKKPTKKLDTDDIPTPPAGVDALPAVIVPDPPLIDTPIKLEQVLATGSLQGRTCVTCGNITADNACLVCGTRIGGDA
jgi:hypothetical protein